MSQKQQWNGNRRAYLKTLGTLGLAGLAGCSGGGGGGSTTTGGGSGGTTTSGGGDGGMTTTSGGSGSYHIGFANMGLAGDPWLLSFQNGAEWYAQDHGMKISITDAKFKPSKQIKDVRNLLRKDIDGLIVSPLDSSALASVVDEATSQGVPVFTANTTAFSENVRMFTAFGNANAARVAGDIMVQKLKERFGSPEGKVVEVLMPQKAKTFVQRHKGFFNRIKEEPNVEIINQVKIDEASTADVTNKMSTQLQQGGFDAIYCPDLTSEIGTISALENQNMKVPAGQEGHITMTGIDAGPNILTEIKGGYMDASVDQPNLFYGPISIKYMVDYLNAGKDESVLPQTGTKVTAQELTIDGNNHAGTDPWAKPIWAPGQVENLSFDGGSQRFFRTQEVVVTKDNADAPYLWGNIAESY